MIWVIFWISIWKLSWVFRGKIDVSLENDFWLPKPARSAQTVKNSHSFFNVSYTWYKSLVIIFMKICTDLQEICNIVQKQYQKQFCPHMLQIPYKSVKIFEMLLNQYDVNWSNANDGLVIENMDLSCIPMWFWIGFFEMN